VSEFPKRVDSWITSDGKVHTLYSQATLHEDHVTSVKAINAALWSGSTLLAAFEQAGSSQSYNAEQRDVLAQLKIGAGISIPHWQCRDEPGYTLIQLENSGGFWVSGDSGSWSGPYGAVVSFCDLIWYASATMERHGGVLPQQWKRLKKNEER
jgi:hypothetical protein